MSYRDRWADAKFRDVVFLTDSHTAKSGRNVAQHIYVGSEISDSEDLGAKPWDFQINAYFIGSDYDIARDEFLAVLNQPEPSWLTHPWLGRFWVRASEWSIEESNDKGGFCTISVSFVPAREDELSAEADLNDLAQAGIDDFIEKSISDFNLLKMSSEGAAAFVSACQEKLEGLRDIISFSQAGLSTISAVTTLIQGIIFDIRTITEIPDQYANSLKTLYSTIASGADELFSYERPSVVVRLAANVTGVPPVISGVSAFETAVRKNLQTETDLQDRLMIAAVANMALTDYQHSEDRDAVVSIIDKTIEKLLPSMSDAVFQAAVTMQASVKAVLMSQDLQPTVTKKLIHPLPAVLLAYRLQTDEDELIVRNRIRHPLFVQGEIHA